MTKIDLEKFICSMFTCAIDSRWEAMNVALKDQGLEFKDGHIVEIKYHCTGIGTPKEAEGVLKEMIDKFLEIKAGQWYMCIRDLDDDYDTSFTKGRVYKSTVDGALMPDNSNIPHKIIATDHYFRPATEEEILTKKFQDLDPNYPYNKNGLKTETKEKLHGLKFKVGDWVVHDMSDGRKVIRQIINMTDKSYILDGKDFNVFYFNDLENDYRLWTIQDADDGDVLARGKFVLVFKCLTEFDNKQVLVDYFHCDSIRFYCQDLWELNGFKPATQEQRDLLESKIQEAGYLWDSNKKQLKKIQKPDLDNTNGTNTIKFDSEEQGQVILYGLSGSVPEQPEEELAEFEKQFEAYMFHPNTDHETISACCKKLLSIAKKELLIKQR